MNKIYAIILVFLVVGCAPESPNEKVLSAYINAVNTGNRVSLDTLLASSFKFISDSVSKNREQYFSDVFKQDTTWKIALLKIEEVENKIKTKSNLTSYSIRTLGMNPIYCEREYSFNPEHKIEIIYMTKYVSLPEHNLFDNYFAVWARIYYPEITQRVQDKMSKGEDYFEERHFLLMKLKQDGLYMLDSAKAQYEKVLEARRFEQKRIENLPPAPFNDYVLTKIFNTATSLMSNVDDISKIPLKDRLTFLRQAYIKNGYSYTNSLEHISEYGFSAYWYLQYIRFLEVFYDEALSTNQVDEVFTKEEQKYFTHIKKIAHKN